jgi:hypothetical protein
VGKSGRGVGPYGRSINLQGHSGTRMRPQRGRVVQPRRKCESNNKRHGAPKEKYEPTMSGVGQPCVHRMAQKGGGLVTWESLGPQGRRWGLQGGVWAP